MDKNNTTLTKYTGYSRIDNKNIKDYIELTNKIKYSMVLNHLLECLIVFIIIF